LEQKKMEEDIKKIMSNLSVIADSLVKLNSLYTQDSIKHISSTTRNLFVTLLDFTTTYNYIGLSISSGASYIPKQAQTNIKEALSKIKADSTKISGAILEGANPPGRNSDIISANQIFIDLIGRVTNNINDLITTEQGQDIQDICKQIFPNTTRVDVQTTGVSQSPSVVHNFRDSVGPENLKKRMAHFIKDLSSLMSLLNSSQEYITVFETYPNLLKSIGEDIQELETVVGIDCEPFKIAAIGIKQKILDTFFSKIEGMGDSEQFLKGIQKLYNCIIDILNDDKLFDMETLMSTLGITDQDDASSKYSSLIKTIDSNNNTIDSLLMVMRGLDVDSSSVSPILSTSKPIYSASTITDVETAEEADESKVGDLSPDVHKRTKILSVLKKDFLLDYIWSNTKPEFWRKHGIEGEFEKIKELKNIRDLIEIITEFESSEPSLVESTVLPLKHIRNDIFNDIKVGSIISIMDSHTDNKDAKIVGLGIVERVFFHQKAILFKVLTKYTQIDPAEDQAPGKINLYYSVYLKTCQFTTPKELELTKKIKIHGGSATKKTIDTNQLVVIMGENDRKAGIGVVSDGDDKFKTEEGKFSSLKVRVLTELTSDEGEKIITNDIIDLALEWVKTITPEDILQFNFHLQPNKKTEE
jgi:hypothetical protein